MIISKIKHTSGWEWSFILGGIVCLCLFSCASKRELLPPITQEEQQRTIKDIDAEDSLETIAKLEHEFKEDVEISYRIKNQKGIFYSVEGSSNPIERVEAYVDSEWVKIDKWELIEKNLSNCAPSDYTLILDLSGSMQRYKRLISKEAERFIRHKNNDDHVALIKYGSSPLLVSNYSSDEATLTNRLEHVADSTIGGGTKTGRAYELYVDEVMNQSISEGQSVILFTDISGAAMDRFDKLARENLEKRGIQTHKVIYFKKAEEFGLIFTLITSKKQIKTAFNDDYGYVFRVKDLKSIGDLLKRVIDQNCTFNKILFKRPMNAEMYRITAEYAGREMIDTVFSIIPIEDSTYQDPDSTVVFGEEEFHVGDPILLNVYFDTGSDSLLAESNEEIVKVYQIMTEYPEMEIEIRGHTDNRGTRVYNEDLSQRRAIAVLNALIKKGIDGSRMTAKGIGFQQPVATNETPEGRAKNRRTEFVILKK